MIENLQFIKIKNGWVVTVTDRGITKDHVEDEFLRDKDEIIKWIRENVK